MSRISKEGKNLNRVNLEMSEDLFKDAKEFAQNQEMSLSVLIRQALIKYMRDFYKDEK